LLSVLPKAGCIGENGAMVQWLRARADKAVMGLALLGLALGAAPVALGQGNSSFSLSDTHPARERDLPDQLPEKPSIAPIFSVPVEPLGFSAPGAIYLGQRNCMASLDFIGEDRLLFTFRVPGLMHREAGARTGSDERQIRAVVLGLPSGAVAAEALWTVHDRIRYLWMLNDGHFLLRDRDGVEEGDAALSLKPLLHFPGPLVSLELDPQQKYLVTNSQEPATAEQKAGDVGSPATAQADVTEDSEKPGVPDMVVRILRRESGKVMLVSRVRTAVHLPINADGYLETLRGNGEQWLMNLNYFSGGSMVLGHVTSTCAPNFDFISQQELLVTACDSRGDRRLQAMDTGGHRLWESVMSPQAIWPLLVMSPDGSRLARETLAVNHAINAFSPLNAEDIKGQLVRVFDAATGKVALETRATPPLDGGGNVAISPSGRRVAVVNGGAIEVFELPAAPGLAEEKKVDVAR
jgi:hypothetical protein